MTVARFRKCRDLVRYGMVFVKKIKPRFRAGLFDMALKGHSGAD